MNTIKIIKTTHTWFNLEQKKEKYIVFPAFMQELINLEVKKRLQEAQIYVNEYKNRQPNEPSHRQTRAKCLEEMKQFLVFTPDMKAQVKMYFPLMGEPETIWNTFMEDIERDYRNWYEKLTADNYSSSFIVWLNKRPLSMMEMTDVTKRLQ